MIKLTDDELRQIGNAIREWQATPKDKRSVEDVVGGVFAVKCVKCGYWTDKFTVPKQALDAPFPFICTECTSVS